MSESHHMNVFYGLRSPFPVSTRSALPRMKCLSSRSINILMLPAELKGPDHYCSHGPCLLTDGRAFHEDPIQTGIIPPVFLLLNNTEESENADKRGLCGGALMAGTYFLLHLQGGLTNTVVVVVFFLLLDLPVLFTKKSLLDLCTGTTYAKR